MCSRGVVKENKLFFFLLCSIVLITPPLGAKHGLLGSTESWLHLYYSSMASIHCSTPHSHDCIHTIVWCQAFIDRQYIVMTACIVFPWCQPYTAQHNIVTTAFVQLFSDNCLVTHIHCPTVSSHDIMHSFCLMPDTHCSTIYSSDCMYSVSQCILTDTT